jgi:hypothetical protein
MQRPKRLERATTQGASGPRCRRRIGHALAPMAFLSAVACLGVSPAFAARPTISNFKVSPTSVGVAGGTVEVSATVTNATSCTLYAKHVSGYPRPVGCGPKIEVALPPNPKEKKRYGPIKVKILLKAMGEGTAKASASATVAASAPNGKNCLDFKPAANLVECDLAYATIGGANLSGANLERADLEHADVEGANLENANLEAANLEFVNLKVGNLTLAAMKNTRLPGANLDGAESTDATVNEGIYSFSNPTICPEGRTSNEFGNPGSCPFFAGP